MDKIVAVESARKEKMKPAVVSAHAAPANEMHAGSAAHPATAARFVIDHDAMRDRRVIFPSDPGDPARAYKMLRTQVLRRVRREHHRVIGITSPADGDGKTLTCVNLALSLAAEPNQTVLLVDLDLHRPSVARILGLEQLGHAGGIESCLRDRTDVARVLRRPQGIERLAVLPAGVVGSGSSELLAADATRSLMAELRARYEDRLILVDLPPVLLTDDVLTLMPMLDAVLLVVTERQTRREDLARTMELLQGVPLLGTVLNQAHEVERRVY
jgi:capsular exopolysaccharide synthesis family protein